jgi:hypothetical protein
MVAVLVLCVFASFGARLTRGYNAGGAATTVRARIKPLPSRRGIVDEPEFAAAVTSVGAAIPSIH